MRVAAVIACSRLRCAASSAGLSARLAKKSTCGAAALSAGRKAGGGSGGLASDPALSTTGMLTGA